jgi:ribonucleoside-diphosphate reductase alpha chain
MNTKTFSENNLEVYPGPLWAINNPYLGVLSTRFFSDAETPDWSDLSKRVGRLFLEAEKKYSSMVIAEQKALEIVALINEGAFLPNSPVMMNSEHSDSINLFACHVLSPPKHFNDLDVAKQIHDGCGGIGYDFSKMDDPVAATLNIEKQTKLLNPNRKRKAHSAVTLSYMHPKAHDFILLSPELTITHTNIEFDSDFFDGLAAGKAEPLALWNILCESIYKTGRPSLSFSSEKEKRSNCKLINNVCGESLLRENESSLIGSINLTKFVHGGIFDFDRFKNVAKIGLRCLDNLHDIQDHASDLVQSRCLESRKVGVGVMGYSDALLLLNMRYGSEESLEFVKKMMSLLQANLISESELLGEERGYCNTELLLADTSPRRNASLMAVPANGTLSLIANVSGGIEPIFSYMIKQRVQDKIIYQLQPTFKSILESYGVDSGSIFNELREGKTIESLHQIPDQLKRILVTANDLTTQEHIFTQAMFQSHIDGGISKTINLPNSATIDDIKNAILLAEEKGCVGVSLYRNGSFSDQPTQ